MKNYLKKMLNEYKNKNDFFLMKFKSNSCVFVGKNNEIHIIINAK